MGGFQTRPYRVLGTSGLVKGTPCRAVRCRASGSPALCIGFLWLREGGGGGAGLLRGQADAEKVEEDF